MYQKKSVFAFIMINFFKLTKSFKHAGRGIISVYKGEQNFRIHCMAGFLVIIISVFLEITILEWIIVFFLISILLILELINTALEKVIDVIKPRVHEYAADIKDIMAGAVLISAFMCAMGVLIVFIPHILKLFVR